jgi:hypothetical protein
MPFFNKNLSEAISQPMQHQHHTGPPEKDTRQMHSVRTAHTPAAIITPPNKSAFHLPTAAITPEFS